MSDFHADIVVGTVSASPRTAGDRVWNAATLGVKTYFPQYSWLLVETTADPSSPSKPVLRTANRVEVRTPRFGVHRVTFPWHGVPAKTNGYRAILELACQSGAAVCLLTDPAQQGLDASWVDALVRPGIHSKYDLVTPIYSSSSRSHLLSGTLVSPMLRSLFGYGARHPLAGDLLISRRLMERLLARHDWDSPSARYAPELWMNFIAVAEQFRVAESIVGPSIHAAKMPRLATQTAFAQIMTALFGLIDQYDGQWSALPSAFALDRFGQPPPFVSEAMDTGGLPFLVRFANAFPALRPELKTILNPHTFSAFSDFHDDLLLGRSNRHLGDAVWARAVCEMAAAWKQNPFSRGQILGLITPLFLAQAGSFLMQTQYEEHTEVEAHLDRLAGYFQAMQPVLCKLWSARTGDSALIRECSLHGAEAT